MNSDTIFVLVLLFCAANCEEPVYTKLSTGITLTKIEMTPYETTVPLIFEMRLPKIDQWTQLLRPLKDQTISAILNQTHKIALDLLPIFPTHSDNSVRHKRAIEIIGDFYNWCCGLAKQKSVDTILVNQGNLDHFTQELEQQITEEHKNIVRSTTLFSSHLNELEEAINEIEHTEGTEIKAIAKNEKLLEESEESAQEEIFSLAIGLHQGILNQAWITTVADCRQSRLPLFLINHATLRKELRYLSHELDGHNKELAVPLERLDEYFRYQLTSCLFSSKKVIVTLKVPVRTKKIKYETFEIIPLPFMYNNNICQVDLNVNFVATTRHRTIPIISAMEQHCNPYASQLCQLPRFDPPQLPEHNCLHAIMSSSSVDTINSHCHMT